MADTNIIKLGNNDLNFKVGSSDCKIYLGDILLYPKDVPPTPFSGKYKLILTDDSVVSGECDASSAITINETSAYKTTLKEAVIGDCVTSIDGNAFYNCSGLTSIEIPSGVTSIGYSAFYNCSSITNINIPNSVTNIGLEAFYGCSGITSITISDSVTSISSSTFYGCTSLTSIEIPSGVTSIRDSAFQNCTSLTSCTIGSGVTSIGRSSFLNCSGLTSIEIPDSVTNIVSSAFQNCSGLTSVTVNATTPPTLVGSYVFYNTNNCPIYVPSASVNTYKTASEWMDYAPRIQAIS